MNTKEAIEFLKRIKNLELYSDMGYVFEADKIIKLLKRGEKYEKMWEELENITSATEWDMVDLEEIKQKYFPNKGV